MTKLANNPMLQSPEIAMKFRILHAVDGPLDKLSMKDICANASIARDTFYRHFESKYDIAIWHGKFIQSLYLDNVGRTIDWKTGYFHDLRLLAEEQEFYRFAMRNLGRKLKEFPEMDVHRKAVMLETLTEWKHVEIDDTLMFCIDTFVALETVLVTQWLRNRCTPSPDEFADRLISVVPCKLFTAMEL